MSQMDKWAGVAAIHIRTGFADWQEYWLTQAKPTDQSEITKMEGKYACDPVTIVKNVGVVFKQCNGRYDETVCTNWWTLPAGVKKDDASAFDATPLICPLHELTARCVSGARHMASLKLFLRPHIK